MEQISILFSVILACNLSLSIFKDKPHAFTFVGALVLFVSIVAISGFIGGNLGMGVNGYLILFGSTILFTLGKILVNEYTKKNHLKGIGGYCTSLTAYKNENKKASWIFIFALVAWMLFSLNLSSWQITPHGYSVDSAAHYALVRFLYDYKHLPGSDWSFLWEIAHYPFGFHLTTAILSTLIGVSPFYVMWIFSAFLMGVVVASVCTMVFSDLRPRKTFAFIASVWSFAMFVVSPYVMESYSISGFYPMVLGLVFIAMFVWCLRIITELTKGLVFFVTIAFAGMGLTYPQWLPILYLLYIYLVYTRPNAIGVNKIIALAIPLLASAIIGLGFAAQHWAGLKYIYNIEGGVPKDLRYIALLLLGSSLLIFSTSYHKQQRDYLFVLFILILQVGLVVVSKKLAGLGGLYPMYKYAYVLTPIFILVLAQEYQCDNKLRKYANYKLAVPILILLASGINAYHMHSLLRPSPAYLKVNEYHVLKWVAKNTVNKSVAYMGEAPFPLFGYAITGKAQFHGEFGWWVQPTIQLEAWEEQASKGEVAILLHVKDGEGKQFDHAKFQVLYKEGDCVAIQKV